MRWLGCSTKVKLYFLSLTYEPSSHRVPNSQTRPYPPPSPFARAKASSLSIKLCMSREDFNQFLACLLKTRYLRRKFSIRGSMKTVPLLGGMLFLLYLSVNSLARGYLKVTNFDLSGFIKTLHWLHQELMMSENP